LLEEVIIFGGGRFYWRRRLWFLEQGGTNGLRRKAANVAMFDLTVTSFCIIMDTRSPSMLYFANVLFIYFFNGRLILRPWLTEVRESFTRGGPWVWLEKLLLGFFLVIFKLQGGPKSDEIWHIFRPRPQTCCLHARTRQNIVILKKNLLSTDGCSTRVRRFVNFGVKTPEIHAPYYCS